MGWNEIREWGLALGTQAQKSLIDLIGMSFIPLYSVVGPFIFFMSLLLMVWGGLRLVVTIFLRMVIIVRYRGCGAWTLTAFWGTAFQLAVSPSTGLIRSWKM
jgi:fatty acid desaturase